MSTFIQFDFHAVGLADHARQMITDRINSDTQAIRYHETWEAVLAVPLTEPADHISRVARSVFCHELPAPETVTALREAGFTIGRVARTAGPWVEVEMYDLTHIPAGEPCPTDVPDYHLYDPSQPGPGDPRPLKRFP